MKNNYFNGKIIGAKEANDMMMKRKEFGAVYPSQEDLISLYESKKEFFNRVNNGIIEGAKKGSECILVELSDEAFDEIDTLLMIVAFYRDLGFDVSLKRNEKEITFSISWGISYVF